MSAPKAASIFSVWSRVSALCEMRERPGAPLLALTPRLLTARIDTAVRQRFAEKGGIYVLDEPTAGLHLADVDRFLVNDIRRFDLQTFGRNPG